MDQQVSSAVSSTGNYPWSIQLKLTYSDATVTRNTSGFALVVVNSGGTTGYYGWDVGSRGQLVGVNGGVQWVTGKGGSRYFEQLTSTTFLSPSNDFGSLVKNANGTYTYTAADQTKYDFDTSGNLVDVVDPHSLRLTYTYASGRLSTVNGPDGGTTTFQYDGSNRLTTILQAGGGVLLLTPTNSDLTGFTDATNQVRVFAYDASHHLTVDQLSPATTTVTYDSTSGLATAANMGSGATQSLAPQANLALSGQVAKATAAVGTFTDAGGSKATYTLDAVGRVTLQSNADGGTQGYTRNNAGLVTVSTDPLGHVTSYTYDAYGDVTQIQYPDGGIWTYQYDATFHKMTLSIDPRGDRTTYTLDATTGDVLTIKNALNQVTTQTWSGGLLQTVTDPLGHTTTYQYDATTRRLTDVIDPTGARTTYGYDAAGDQTSIQDARGNTVTYTYDGNRRLTGVQYPDGGQVTYVYNALGQKTSQTDQLGHVTNWAYDQHGWLTTQTEAAGTSVQRVTTTAYDSRGNVLSTTDALGHTTSYAYDSMDRQTAQVGDSTGIAARTTTVYDLAGNVTSVADPLNHITSYAYDSMNRKTRQIDAYGTSLARTTTTAYDLAGDVTSTTDPRGMVTCYQYDALNRQTTAIADRFDPGNNNLQATTTTAYDAAGNVLSTTDPLGHTTSYAYDAANRRTATVEAYGVTGLARTSTTAYDAAGNVVSVVDARGTIGSYAYDAMNRRTATVQAYGQPEQAVTTTAYDLAGNVLSVTDPTGTVTSYAYDALNRKTQEIDAYNVPALKRTLTTTYDAANNVVQTTDALGYVTSMGYDGLNRLVSTQDANGNISTRVYDAAGNLTATVDPLGDRTTTAYDALNRAATVLDARGGVVTYLYDANSNQTTVVDPVGNRTTMAFDYLGRKTQQTDPLNHSSTFVYDLAGNLTSTIDRNGNIRNMSYDTLNRLTTEVWLAGGVNVNTVTYSRDANDNLLTAVNAYGAYTMAYDRLNRMTSEQEPFGAVLTFAYSAAGDRTSVQDSFGATTTDTYDALHRLATIQLGGASQTPLRVDMSYTARDQLATLTRYSDLNGTATVGLSAYSYDPGQRLTNLQHRNGLGTTLQNYTYTYDSGNRVTAEQLNGSATSYGYDVTNQLTTVTTGSGSTTYSYDLNGNRTVPGYQTGAANQLTNDGIWTYTYDNEGNLTKRSKGASAETWTYGYDNLNRLVWARDAATDGGAGTILASYVYDAVGNRIEKDVWQTGGTTTVTRFAYDHADVWADTNSGNTLQTRYVHGNVIDQIFARATIAGTATWYLTDRLGSVRNLTDNSGALQDTLTYDAYGNVIVESNAATGDRYRFTSREYDAEIGEYQYRARQYDSVSGRFLSEDPLAFAAHDSNLYRYVGNAPSLRVDPQGTVASGSDAGGDAQFYNFPDDSTVDRLITVMKEVEARSTLILQDLQFLKNNWGRQWGQEAVFAPHDDALVRIGSEHNRFTTLKNRIQVAFGGTDGLHEKDIEDLMDVMGGLARAIRDHWPGFVYLTETNDKVAAYTWPSLAPYWTPRSARVYIYANFWNEKGAYQARTLLHELSHYYLNTSDTTDGTTHGNIHDAHALEYFLDRYMNVYPTLQQQACGTGPAGRPKPRIRDLFGPEPPLPAPDWLP